MYNIRIYTEVIELLIEVFVTVLDSCHQQGPSFSSSVPVPIPSQTKRYNVHHGYLFIYFKLSLYFFLLFIINDSKHEYIINESLFHNDQMKRTENHFRFI